MFVHFDDHLAGGVGPGHQWNQCSRVLQHGQRAQQVKIMSRCVNDESTYWIWWLSLLINVHGQVASGAEAWRPRRWEVLGIFNLIEKWWKLLCNRFGHSWDCFQSSLALYFPWPWFRQQRWFLTQQLLWCCFSSGWPERHLSAAKAAAVPWLQPWLQWQPKIQIQGELKLKWEKTKKTQIQANFQVVFRK